MADNRRDRAVRQERGRGVVRALYTSELGAIGDERREARRVAQAQLDKVARLLPDALAGGLSIAEISRLTDVSRPTLHELRGRFSEDAGDLRLGILQAVANRGGAARSEIVPGVFVTNKASQILDELIKNGLVESEVNEENPDDVYEEVWMSEEGFRALADWTFDIEEEEALWAAEEARRADA